MSENNTKNNACAGQIQISDDVISIIAATAAMEVDGIYAIVADNNGATEIFSKRTNSKGVKIFIEDGETDIEVDVCMNLGFKLYEVGMEVQKRIKLAIETMTGIVVSNVNVNVKSVAHEDSNII